MKIRCFCIVLIVSGALLTEVNNNLSLSGNNLLVVNNLQNKTTPATFIEWRNMFDIKMTWLISPNSDKYKQIPLNIKNTNR